MSMDEYGCYWIPIAQNRSLHLPLEMPWASLPWSFLQQFLCHLSHFRCLSWGMTWRLWTEIGIPSSPRICARTNGVWLSGLWNSKDLWISVSICGISTGAGGLVSSIVSFRGHLQKQCNKRHPLDPLGISSRWPMVWNLWRSVAGLSWHPLLLEAP